MNAGDIVDIDGRPHRVTKRQNLVGRRVGYSAVTLNLVDEQQYVEYHESRNALQRDLIEARNVVRELEAEWSRRYPGKGDSPDVTP